MTNQDPNIGKQATSGFVNGFAGCLGVAFAIVLAIVALVVLGGHH